MHWPSDNSALTLRVAFGARLPFGTRRCSSGRLLRRLRLWATERKHLPLPDVAAAGGWKSAAALQQSYIGTDPDTILKVVENAG